MDEPEEEPVKDPVAVSLEAQRGSQCKPMGYWVGGLMGGGFNLINPFGCPLWLLRWLLRWLLLLLRWLLLR